MANNDGSSRANPDHHLWNNNGTWWLHYTEYPTPVTKQRVRRSLRTKSIRKARRLRDALFHTLQSVSRTPVQPATASLSTRQGGAAR
jgi:hypothetical protein